MMNGSTNFKFLNMAAFAILAGAILLSNLVHAGENLRAIVDFGKGEVSLNEAAQLRLDEAIASIPNGSSLSVVGYSCYINDRNNALRVASERAYVVSEYLANAGFEPASVTSETPVCNKKKKIGRKAFVYLGKVAPIGMGGPTDETVGEERVNIDFKDADIRVVIRTFAEMTGKNFVVDEKVKGKVTIISPRKVTKNEALKVFESTLEVYGYSLIVAGDVTKVVPTLEARQRASFDSDSKIPGDRMQTRIIQIDNVKAVDMANTLRPLIPPTSFITAYQPSNTLIISDYASNIERAIKIIKQLDSPAHEESVTVINLQHAGAKDLAGKLSKIYSGSQGIPGRAPRAGAAPGQPRMNAAFSGNRSGGAKPQIIADERTNALIVIAPRPVTERILSLVSKLDVIAPKGHGKINVYYLKNADAEELSKTLGTITSKSSTAAPNRMAMAGRPNVQLNNPVTVTPDVATNSLVITAEVEDYETLKSVIDKLDIRRRQVFVEALIMEVSSTKKREFGVEWRTTSNFTEDGVQGFGGQDYGNIGAVAADPLAAPLGLAIGVVDGVIEYGGKEFLNIGALVHALQKETGVNVLSTPNIMTTDNVEAEIVVANEVPLEGQTTVTTGGNTVQSIERKNIGLTLRIKPQISESDEVRLDVYQEISAIAPTQLDRAKDIITTKRSIKTSVVVKDKQNVVLGGLIRDDFRDIENKVPILGDIPLIGWLFKSTSREKEKTNLLVFLTPHIIREGVDMDRVTDRKSTDIKVNEKTEEAYREYAKHSNNPEPAPAPEPLPEYDDEDFEY